MPSLAIPPALRQFWQQRNPRERAILGAGVILGGGLLLWMLVVAPTLRERERLSRSLPALRLDVAEFKRDLAKLRPQATGQASALQPEINALAVALNIAPNVLRIEGAPNGHVILKAQGISWATWIKLLEQARARGAQALRLSAQSADGGLVNAEVELSR